MEIAKIAAEIMPNGEPDFRNMIYYKPIAVQVKEENGEINMWKSISSIIINFCAHYNVKFSMSTEQINVCAKALLDECGNYRLEDYFTMFEMATQNKLLKIYDRIDQQIIFSIKEAYDNLRFIEGEKIREEKEKAEQKAKEDARIEKLNSTTAIDVDFKQILSIIEASKKKNYDDGLQRKKERLNQLREEYAKIHSIDTSKIQRTFKTEPDENDIEWINKCFTPKKKKQRK